MSIEAMSVVLHHANINPAAKLVLMGIANHQGDGGAWPSIDTLAKYANVSRRSVSTYITELVRRNYLIVEPQQGRNGTNLYWIAVQCPENCDRTTNHREIETMQPVAYPMQIVAHPHATAFIPPMQTVAYKPSINLNKNLSVQKVKTSEQYAIEREARLAHAREISEELALAKLNAAEPPICEHGLVLVRCLECCKALND